MPFIHPLLLGGLLALGLPVLLHLLMRQKPKHILFPAFRFLQQRAKTNQRKLRLRHLLLLALRMLLLALIVLALARPRLSSDRIGGVVGSNQSVAAVLLFDTSRSMEYTVAGKNRLDDAKQRAMELLDDVSETSRIAVVDAGDPNREWLSVSQARDHIRNLNLHAGCPPVTSAIAVAYALFDDLNREPATPENEALPRLLYLFSDRTTACWDGGRLGDLLGQRDRVQTNQPVIAAYLIDVGVDKPIDVALSFVEIKPQSFPASKEAEAILKATVTATGLACDAEIMCRISGENTPEKKSLKLEAGQSEVVEFRRRDLKPGLYQAELTLAAADALPGNNVRFATFEVRQARKILIVTDDEDYANFLEIAFAAKREFDADVKTPGQINSPDDLQPYLAVCLLSVRAPADKTDGPSLWDKVRPYVARGGHLCVFPGRDEMRPAEYKQALDLLPGEFVTVIARDEAKGVHWDDRRFTKHALLAKYPEWREQGVSFVRRPRTATRFWQVKPSAKENVVVSYDDRDASPALLERVADRVKGSGKVLMFTTSFDDRSKLGEPAWNDYAVTVDPAFLLVIVNEAMKYLVGDLEEVNFNYTSGQVVALPLPPGARFPEYAIDGPGITGSDTRLPRGESEADLRLRNTDLAGNFKVMGGTPPWETRFSLNPPANEYQLDRVPVEEIEKLFGPGSVLAVEQGKKLTEIVSSQSRQPIELFPWLMVLFVASLVVESYLANRFYKPATAE